MTFPVLYSFRRCPYAIRARLALRYAGISYELKEVALRDKPAEMLALSPKGTVPVLHLHDGRVLDQSLDIMRWALVQHDPDGWLSSAPTESMQALINDKRRQESEKTVAELAIEVEKAGSDNLLAKESAINLKLSDYLLRTTTRLNQLTEQNLKTKQLQDNIKDRKSVV